MKFDERNNYKNTDRTWPAGTRIFALPDHLGWIALDPTGKLSFISPGYAAVTDLEKVDEVIEPVYEFIAADNSSAATPRTP